MIMTSKGKVGIQIRFHPDTENDVIAFFNPLKKAEMHITAIAAFRMYMRTTGFYERVNGSYNTLQSVDSPEIPDGFEDEALQDISGMFENDNDTDG